MRVTVFERIEDTEIRHTVMSGTEDTNEEDLDVKYLKYQVKLNNSSYHKSSNFALSSCLLVNFVRLIVK